MATRKTKTTTPKTPSSRARSKSTKGVAIHTPTLDPKIFDVKVSEVLINQVLHVYQSRSHQNTHKVKTRGEVNRTTKKVYKQKGTGNARHGARSAPIYVGGGVSHGPDGVRGRNLKVNRKMALKALVGLLTNRAKTNSVSIFEIDTKQKPSLKAIKGLFSTNNTLVVHSNESTDFIKSARNLKNLTLINSKSVNPLAVARNNEIKLTSKAQADLVARLSPELKK